jgi:hypothetical protein
MREWQRIERLVQLAVARPLAGVIFILFLGVRGIVRAGRRFRGGRNSGEAIGMDAS